MKAIVIHAARDLRIEERDPERPGPGHEDLAFARLFGRTAIVANRARGAGVFQPRLEHARRQGKTLGRPKTRDDAKIQALRGQGLSYTAIQKQLGVSRVTLRHALSNLVNEGLMVKEHGRGTFVADKEKDLSAGTLYVAKYLDVLTESTTARIQWIKLGSTTSKTIEDLVNVRGIKPENIMESLGLMVGKETVLFDVTTGEIISKERTEVLAYLKRNDGFYTLQVF